MRHRSTEPEFFERMYDRAPDADPWGFASDADERERYRTLVELLPERRFRSCLEPGCSIGELTALLAARCESVLAMDVAPTAIRRAVERHGHLGGVEFRVGALPEDLPDHSTHDLICLSEIGYYFTLDALDAIVRELSSRLVPDGIVLAGHWTGSSPDHVLSGEQVHDVLATALGATGLSPVVERRRYDGFVVDMWRRGTSG